MAHFTSQWGVHAVAAQNEQSVHAICVCLCSVGAATLPCPWRELPSSTSSKLMVQPVLDGDGAATKDDATAAGVAFVVAIEATGESMAQAAAAATVLVVAVAVEANNCIFVAFTEGATALMFAWKSCDI